MDFENQMFVELLSEDGLIILARQGWETHTCTQLHYGSTLKSMVGHLASQVIEGTLLWSVAWLARLINVSRE